MVYETFSYLHNYYMQLYCSFFFINKNIKEYFSDCEDYTSSDNFINNIKWIPYSQITNLEQIAEGGFGIVYKALNNGNAIAIKTFSKFQNFNKYFINEVIFLILLILFIICYTDFYFYNLVNS